MTAENSTETTADWKCFCGRINPFHTPSCLHCRGGVRATEPAPERQKSGHTPGPWRVGMPSGHNANQIYAGEDAVCQVYDLFCHTGVKEMRALAERFPRTAVAIANAELIAAAPETLAQRDALLAACRRVLASQHMVSGYGGIEAELRAAIALCEKTEA